MTAPGQWLASNRVTVTGLPWLSITVGTFILKGVKVLLVNPQLLCHKVGGGERAVNDSCVPRFARFLLHSDLSESVLRSSSW
jgi:hypothetical protein